MSFITYFDEAKGLILSHLVAACGLNVQFGKFRPYEYELNFCVMYLTPSGKKKITNLVKYYT